MNQQRLTTFKELKQNLLFQSNIQGGEDLVFSHLKTVKNLLDEFIARESIVDEEIREQLKQLPTEGHYQIISSPYICEMLMVAQEKSHSDKIEQLKFQVAQALVAVIKVFNKDFKHKINPLWTAGGEEVFDDEVRELFPPLQSECGIRLNYQSYAHNTGKKGIAGYNLQESLVHKERIETAKNIIAQVNPSALSLVDVFTTFIQFRKNTLRKSIVNSSSHTSIGLIRCDNFHGLHKDMPEIVDMLVHESIHQYLHLVEEQKFDFVDTERIPEDLLEQRIFPSPWSGNPLDIRSYTHAILVWYGLYNFWTHYEQSHFQHAEIKMDQIQDKIKESTIGFLKAESVMANFGEHIDYLTPEYQSLVSGVQKEIRALHKHPLRQTIRENTGQINNLVLNYVDL